AAAGGQVAFSSLNKNIDVWSLAIDANQAKATGGPQRLTQGAAGGYHPAVSPDGEKVAFISSRAGNPDVWVKDLATGKESAITTTPVGEFLPRFSPDGGRLAYVANESGKSVIYVVSLAGGAPEKVCEDCGSNISWASDGKGILYVGRSPARISLLDLASKQ